ncbi:MAG: hypothetical protein HRU20_22665 [Pseudomonadales bacterium]|nr:hypothetical protein [Pseudomonadales bacterium]
MKYQCEVILIFSFLIAVFFSLLTPLNVSGRTLYSSDNVDWELILEDEFTGSKLNDEK